MSKAPPTKLVKIHPYITVADKRLLDMLAKYFGSSHSDVIRSALRSYATAIVTLDTPGVELAHKEGTTDGD